MANSLLYKKKHFHIGDTLEVSQKVLEGDKERTQVFEGVLIAVSGRDLGKSFTVRKIAVGGIGVERIWPLYSPGLVNIKRTRKGSARRAKLYYLRGRTGKTAIKVKEKTFSTKTKAAHAPKTPSRTSSRKPGKKVSRK